MSQYDDEFFASDWFISRPKVVQDAFRKYSAHTFYLDGRRYWMTGVREYPSIKGAALLLSLTDPDVDYAKACAETIAVCACGCFRNMDTPGLHADRS